MAVSLPCFQALPTTRPRPASCDRRRRQFFAAVRDVDLLNTREVSSLLLEHSHVLARAWRVALVTPRIQGMIEVGVTVAVIAHGRFDRQNPRVLTVLGEGLGFLGEFLAVASVREHDRGRSEVKIL